jgi:hypothetical protein
MEAIKSISMVCGELQKFQVHLNQVKAGCIVFS